MEESEPGRCEGSVQIEGKIIHVLHATNTVRFATGRIDTNLNVIFDSLLERKVAPSFAATCFS